MGKAVIKKSSFCRKHGRYRSVIVRLSRGEVCEEVCDLEKRYSELYSEMLQAKENARKCEDSLRNCKAEIDLLQEENTTLIDCVNNLETHNVCQSCTDTFENESNTVCNVGPRQRLCKLKN